jgi:hypothetical protein
MRRTLAALLCAPALAVLTGCAAPVFFVTPLFNVAQAGTSAFVSGELQAAYRVPLDQAYNVVLDALANLSYPIKQQSLDEMRAYVQTEEPDGRDVDIRLKKSSEIVTRVNIRVGIWGDQAVSRLVMEQIERKISELGPLQAPAPAKLNGSRPARDGWDY